MSDLVAFIKPRLAEDEAVARQADEVGLHVVTWSGLEPGMSEEGDLVHRHIGRWNPARVLREVEAKRRIMEAYNEANEGKYTGLTYEQGRLDSLELALRLLALPYADHPSYDESWRP